MIEDLLKLARPEIINLVAYSSARREHASPGIYLNANENPYQKASHQTLNRYPQPQPELLRVRLASLYQVELDQILMTRGSDEGIDLWLRAFCSAGKDAIMVCPPTYDMYELSAQIQGASIIKVPLMPETFALDVKKMLSTWNPQCKLIFLCSPNNPTGTVYASEDILSLCQQLKDKAIIIVDEAYIEFSDKPSMTQHLKEHDNLAVLRTLSKAYGMAGARCGVVLAHPMIIDILEKIISPYPLATPVIDIIIQELHEDRLQEIKNQIHKLKQSRNEMADFLKRLSYVEKVWPSETNFLLVKLNKNAKQLVNYCAEKNIIIRDRSHMLGLENCIRITIGLQEENKHLQTLLEQYE
ncbi:MAG: histidinol-phosphate transaminase [Gammaproteobacteria bacterium]